MVQTMNNLLRQQKRPGDARCPHPQVLNPWRKTVQVVVAFVGCLVASSVCHAAPLRAPLPEEVRAYQLVKQLGRSDYAIREQVTSELRQLGAAALGPLAEAVQSSDPEVRYRATQLASEISHISFEKSLERFLENPAAFPDASFPGLKRFREIVTPNKEAYRLFAEMQRVDKEIFEASSLPADAYSKAIGQHMLILDEQFSHNAKPSTQSVRICALLFVITDRKLVLSRDAVGDIYQYLKRSAFASGLERSPWRQTMKELLQAWVVKPNTPGAHHRMLLARSYKLPNTIEAALASLGQSTNPSEIAYALLVVGNSKEQKHIAKLSQLLTNKTCFKNTRPVCRLQVADVALLSLIVLTDQDPRDYNFRHLSKRHDLPYYVQSAYFDTEADRQAALNKWKEYAANRPQPTATQSNEARSN